MLIHNADIVETSFLFLKDFDLSTVTSIKTSPSYHPSRLGEYLMLWQKGNHFWKPMYRVQDLLEAEVCR